MYFLSFYKTAVKCCHQSFEEYLVTTHYPTTTNCNKEMPTEGSTMKLAKHEDKMERPFVVYGDWECSLIKTHSERTTHRHNANSCVFYFAHVWIF